jgi:hypothetical protein
MKKLKEISGRVKTALGVAIAFLLGLIGYLTDIVEVLEKFMGAWVLLVCLGLLGMGSGCTAVEKHQELQGKYVEIVDKAVANQPPTINVLRIVAHENQPITINAKSIEVHTPNEVLARILANFQMPRAPYADAVNTLAGGLSNAGSLAVGGYFVEKIIGNMVTGLGTGVTNSYNGPRIGGDQVGGNLVGDRSPVGNENRIGDDTTNTTTNQDGE